MTVTIPTIEEVSNLILEGDRDKKFGQRCLDYFHSLPLECIGVSKYSVYNLPFPVLRGFSPLESEIVKNEPAYSRLTHYYYEVGPWTDTIVLFGISIGEIDSERVTESRGGNIKAYIERDGIHRLDLGPNKNPVEILRNINFLSKVKNAYEGLVQQ